MGRLAHSFEQLMGEVEETRNLEAMDLETFDIEDVIDLALEAMEEKSNQLDLIDAEIERLESGEIGERDIAQEFAEDFIELLEDQGNEQFSLESFGLEETVDGVSNILQRMWQVYFLDFLTTFDWLADLVKSSNKRANKYRDRLDASRRKFAKKKPNLDQDKQKASYAQLHNYWMTEKGFVKKPFDQLNTEEKVAEYVLFTYPKTIEKEMGDLSNVAKRADFSDNDAFEKSVVKPLESKKHPVELFDNSLMGGRYYMLLTSFKISGKKKSEADLFSRLGARRKVKVSKRILAATTTGLLPQVIPDVEMTVKEIDQLLDRGDDFLDMTEKYLKQTDQMKREIDSLRKGLESMVADAKKDGGKSTQKDIKNVGRYAKSLIDCYWAPSIKMSKRNIDITKGIAYLANRLIAYSK